MRSASHGTHAIAGYGIASRLDYLLVPILFGLGTGVITMVGTAVGAGDKARARRVAWVGVAIGGGTTALIGAAVAIFPQVWIGLFSSDPVVVATGTQYLRIVAPFYGFFWRRHDDLFRQPGRGPRGDPVLRRTRDGCVLAGFVGWIVAAKFGIGLPTLFAIVAGSYVLYALVCVAGMKASGWGAARQSV